jgi:hypothetical protein
MTDIVIPSRDRIVNANASSAANEFAAFSRVIPSDRRALNLPEENLTSGPLNAFAEDGATNNGDGTFDLTVQSGEAFIGGSYLARDTATTITADFTSRDRTIAVGWQHDQPDAVQIQPADEFGPRDASLNIWFVEDDGGTAVASDRRQFGWALGEGAEAYHEQSLAIGTNASAGSPGDAYPALAVGEDSEADETGIAVGGGATAGEEGIVVGGGGDAGD